MPPVTVNPPSVSRPLSIQPVRLAKALPSAAASGSAGRSNPRPDVAPASAAVASTPNESLERPTSPSRSPQPSLSPSLPCASTSQGALLPPTPSCSSCSSTAAHRRTAESHDSVCIKADTKVKDAAGAIVKVLNRMSNTLVTALRLEASHEALNRAVKAIAVARKYLKDQDPRHELTFLPFNRERGEGGTDPNRFAFLVFKTVLPEGTQVLEHDATDLAVSHGSDPNAVANAVIRIVRERGQAVMKAGGCDAMWVAMTAVVNARRRLKARWGEDVQLVPAWITEDTTAALGRVSKFIRLNALPCAPNGPLTQLA